MTACLDHPLWKALWCLLPMAMCSCGKSPPPVAVEPSTDPVFMGNAQTSRPVPRRTQPLVFTNRPTIVPTPAAPVTNTAPVVTCAAVPPPPCSAAEGVSVVVTAHVGDADGHPLSVVWSANGRDRYTQQVPAGGPPTSAELTYTYTLSQGDHVIKVTVSDGSLSASCDTAVTVQADTQEPVIMCPKNISVPVDPGQCTAVVTFSPRATDNCPDVTVVSDPPSGSAFPIGTTTVTCTATDSAGNTAVCAFEVNVQIANRCPRNDAYWRQNPGAWPVSSMVVGSQVYTRSQLLPLLRASLPSDASVALARQLIVASLNVAAGGDPRPICAELAQANAVLASFGSKLPYRVSVSSAVGRSMLELSTRLNGYNSALLTQDCAP
jgi:hypothetical protein